MMFNPMGSVMRPNPKFQAGRVSTSKTQYAQLYERALQDKISSQLFQQQHEKMANGNRHTPSSASFNMSISTLELIEFVLREYEQNNSVMMQPVAHKKQTYTIYEDLKIVYSLGKDNGNITTASFKRLADEGYVRRTLESIKSRYIDYLKNLTKDDYQNILSYIDLHGLKGFLIFEKNEKGIRLLQKIQKNDPRVETTQGGNSANHTPIRSPRGVNAGTSDRPLSPSMFGHSPSKQMQQNQGFMPYYYPPFPMYPPHQGGNPGGYFPDARMSPYKQFFDPAQQMYQMNMFMNPYMQMNPQFHQMMAAQSRRFMMQQMQAEDEAGFEVRPSFKKSAGKAQAMEVEQEETKAPVASEPRKKAKGNNQEEVVQQKRPKENQQQSNQTQAGNASNNLLKPPQASMNFNVNNKNVAMNVVPKMQPSLIFQKPFQPIPPVVNPQLHPHLKDTELRSSNAMPRALTKEVYDLISDDDRIPAGQFEGMLDYVAEQIKMPKEVLVDKLDALSGSFKDLAVYLETKQDNMLWNSEEDKILESIKSQDSSEFKLLLKLKGLSSIKKRIIYSNIQLPFPIQ